jgi:hypothetical protein
MSAINYLKKLLDGLEVKWLPLGEIGEFIRGNGLQKKDFVESGFPAIHMAKFIQSMACQQRTHLLMFLKSLRES